MRSNLIDPSKLSRREIETLIYINHFWNTKKRMPTTKELRDALGLNSNGFRLRILEKLKDLGYLKARVRNQIAYDIVLGADNANQSSIQSPKARIPGDYERQ